MDGNNGKRLRKTRREPEAFVGRKLTDRTLAILDIIARYRIVPTSAILRLTEGNEDVTHRHLQLLYHRNIVGRMSRPSESRNAEFAYFLEDSQELRDVLKAELPDTNVEPREIRMIGQVNPSRPGRLLFVEHEVMIADFHAAIEIAARSNENVELAEWKQSASTWDRVPFVEAGRARRMLPHRPDAYFVLRFLIAPPGQQRAHFFYEADRGTTNTTRFKLKLQAYLAFFLSGRYQEKYEAKRVRAVLVETISRERMDQLKAVAAKLVASDPFAGTLFWFATSAETRDAGGFAAVWTTAADERKRSVLD